MTAESTRITPLGDRCLSLQLGTDLHPALSRRILHTYRAMLMDAEKPKGVLDVVPAYTSLGIHFDPLLSPASDVEDWIQFYRRESVDIQEQEAEDPEPIEVKVSYEGEDLARIAETNGLTRDEVIARHSAPVYWVAMIGFGPHFPYLLGLDESIACPRLERPRPRVPAGSVAIGGVQTGIYPEATPGGWNLIGTTDPEVCREVEPGDRIRFIPEGPAC